MKISFKVFVLLWCVLSVFNLQPLPAAEKKPASLKFGPRNPAFLKYLEDVKMGKVAEGKKTGLVPPPIDISYTVPEAQAMPEATLPEKYDLRDENKVTPVGDQGDCSTCWAFAAYGSLESYLMPAAAWNFSEDHLDNNDGFDWIACDGGGNHFVATAYMGRWDGPRTEANPTEGVKKHVQRVEFLPERSGYTDNNTIKQYIKNYGAVFAGMYFEWDETMINSLPVMPQPYFNIEENGYYYPSKKTANHAIAIVGWDDNFPKGWCSGDKGEVPSGDGAFIVKNSYGTDWGASGYFYLSYYDPNLCTIVSFNNAESTDNFDRIFYYDKLGWTDQGGFESTTAWAANVFTADDYLDLKAVSFFSNDFNLNYTIYIYRGVWDGNNPRSGMLAATRSGTIAYKGYYTVRLDSPVPLVPGEKFSTVIKYVNSSNVKPIAFETVITGYSSQATAQAGQSYICADGESWEDVKDSRPNANVCIKAFADQRTPTVPVITVTAPAGGEVYNTGETIDINWFTELIDGDIDIILRREDLSYTYDIVLSHPHDASPYNFTIPAAVPPGNYHVLIRKIVSGGDNVYGRSQGEFTIVIPTLTVISPNGGEQWVSGSVQDISWLSTGNVGAVRIEYSIDNGAVYQEIIAATANDGHFAWTVPFTFSDTCRVRISEAVDGAPLDTGDGVFSIHGPDYIAAGTTLSFTNGLRDMLLYRINDNGTKQWRKNFGGSGDDYGHSVQQTADGGFVLAGYSDSDFGGGYNLGGYDFLLYRLDAAGNVQWWKNYGGSGNDYGYSVRQTSDGGFVLAGYSDSDFGGGYNLGGYDFVVYRLDSSGTKLWRKNLGGTGNDYCYSVQPTSDGGYILVGKSDSFTYGGFDFLVYKLDSSGSEEWWNHFGGSGDDWGYSVQQTTDGGYVLAGETTSFSYGGVDYLLYKLDSSGTKQWRQNFGGSGNDYGYSVSQTSDGGFVLAGYSDSDFGGGYNLGGYDFVLYKLDGSGTKQWRQNFGGAGDDYNYAVRPCVDGGYILVGKSDSFTYGGVDFLLYKLDSAGTEQWSQHFGGTEDDEGRSVQQID